MIFRNRAEAGQELAKKLAKYREQNTIIYALPRGGVIVGAEIAQKLHWPLSLVIIRKIGHPSQPEYAVGAVSENGPAVFNESETDYLNPDWLAGAIHRQRQETRRRRLVYLKSRQPVPAQGKTAIITDDGIATGLTMRAAIAEIRQQNPQKIIVAVPVAPLEVATLIANEVDEVAALQIPENFIGSVGDYYQNFPQLTDKEVIGLLNSR